MNPIEMSAADRFLAWLDNPPEPIDIPIAKTLDDLTLGSVFGDDDE